MADCQECNSSVSIPKCQDINYLETLCDPAHIQPIKCTYWSGAPITCLGIATSDSGETVIAKIATALCAINDPVSYSNYIKISATDTTGGYLQSKLLAGTNITITKQNVGANETLTINASYTETPLVLSNTDNALLITPNVLINHQVLLGVKLSTNAGNAITKTTTGLYVPTDSFKVKTSIDDSTEEYLLAKLIAGSNITLTKVTVSGVERISIAATASSGLSNVTVQSSNSINITGNGAVLTPITASLILSSNLNNKASFDSIDGSLLVLNDDKFAKVSAQDTTESYLENKIVAGTGITRTKLNTSTNESLEFSISNSYNGFIRNQTTIQSSSNFYVTGLGRVGSLRSDGDTFLSPSTTSGPYSLLLNNTSTGRVEKITPEAFIADYNLSYILPTATTIVLGGVKVDGVTITISGGVISSVGGYALPTASNSTLGGIIVGNGLSITSGVLSVNPINLATGTIGILPIANGGTGSSTQGWVDLTTNQNNIDGVKTFIGSSLKVTNLLQVNSTDTTSAISSNNTTLNHAILGISTRTISNSGLIYSGITGQFYVNNSSNFAHTNLRNVVGTSGVVYFNNTGSMVLFNDTRTAYSGLNGVVYGGNTGNVTGDFINGISSNAYFSSTASYTNVTGIKLSNPAIAPGQPSYGGTITNYYAVYIPDINVSDIASNITNKYGIYQAGTVAQNYFGGVTTFASGAFDSDMRLKTLIETAPIVNNIGSLKSKSYTKDGQFHIGYFAQEVQEIIPSAVITKNDGFLSVAYHEVHTAKIEYLENKIQELENLLRSK